MTIIRNIKLNVLAALAFANLTASFAANAQVQMDTLAPASSYDAGVLEPEMGGLSPDLWQGTHVEQATLLIQNLPAAPSPSAQKLIRAVLLSGGVPPQASDGLAREHYVATRLGAVLNLGDHPAYASIANSASIDFSSAAFVKLGVKHALLQGDIAKACQTADNVKLERRAPYWAKLRSFCHFTRDEIPAAELTADLLKRSGHNDDVFYTLLGNLTGSQVKLPKTNTLNSPLHMVMAQALLSGENAKALTSTQISTAPAQLARTIALSKTQAPEIQLRAFLRSANILSNEHISQIFSRFAENSLAGLSDIPTQPVWTPQIWGQTFTAIRASTDTGRTAKLIAAMLTQAEAQKVFTPISKVLAQDISLIPASMQAQNSPDLFARIAVQNRDLSTIKEIYLALPEDHKFRGRLALASDALGGGFLGNGLGTDIETRLGQDGAQKSRAVRDVYLAFALGATLPQNLTSQNSEKSIILPSKLKGQPVNAGLLLALKDASRKRRQAETALRAAHMIGEHTLSTLRPDELAGLLMALNDVGLTHISAQLAARDFLDGA